MVCDCDVIEADGGTRTASITGAYVAMVLALRRLKAQGVIDELPLRGPLAAVSVGMVEIGDPGSVQAVLDLPYHEDSRAAVDLNVVMLGDGLVEVQGTGEDGVFSRSDLTRMLDLAEAGCRELFALQAEVLGAEDV